MRGSVSSGLVRESTGYLDYDPLSKPLKVGESVVDEHAVALINHLVHG